MNITLSIVAYKTSLLDLTKVYESIIQIKANWQLYIIDNSPTNKLQSFSAIDDRIIYIYNNKNIGFGAGHNIALNLAIKAKGQWHFIVNPDIYFTQDTASPMVKYMQSNTQIGMMMPEILNPDGSVQNLPKLLPSPLSLVWRKFKKPAIFYKNFINKYELRSVPRGMIYNAPVLSGCFTLLNLNAIKEVGMYDDSFFMYFEDWDLSRRMNQKYKTVYFPEVSVFHGYDSGANKSSKLFKIYLSSALHYFNKWGWVFDSRRQYINKETLSQFK